MKNLRDYVQSQVNETWLPFEGPLLLVTHYRLPAPSSFNQRRRCGLHLLPHSYRPDGDNLDKFVGDALNGVLWKDDCQIVWALRSKTIVDAKVGETILFVRELLMRSPDYESIAADLAEQLRF